MNNSALLILAYNEENNISNTIEELVNDFDSVLVVNDKSTDETKNILDKLKLKYKNLYVLNNLKNLGAGKSFQVGIDELKKYDVENIIKIDGDGQFEKEDVLKIKSFLENKNVQYIKSNRFWENGIEGEIPTIRYFGNTIASILIKFNTGIFSINDPLNGLFGFKKITLKDIIIPKKFNRYGYPFYLNCLMLEKKYLTIEILNKVKYGIGEKSQLRALPIFFKLFAYSIIYFFKNIDLKFKNSNLQVSAFIDLMFLTMQILSFYFFIKFINVRYFSIEGSQTNLFILFSIFQFVSLNLIYRSKLIENRIKKNIFHQDY